jgi:bifunctional UDP-N-acetylglucosamine pyrophosphorylase/glucosamine-1-phosphate N-acetyltransferase
MYVEQPEPKGPGEALLRAKPFLDGAPFFVLYADDLYHPEDLAACIKNTSCVLVKESKNPERFGVCQIAEDDRLLAIFEKQENPPTNLVNIGVYYLTHDIFSIPPIFLPNGEHNLAEQIGALAQKHPVYIARARFWHPIGYPEDVVNAEQWLKLPMEKRLN